MSSLLRRISRPSTHILGLMLFLLAAGFVHFWRYTQNAALFLDLKPNQKDYWDGDSEALMLLHLAPDRDLFDYNFSHPLENTCRFPILERDEPALAALTSHPIQARCPPTAHALTLRRVAEDAFVLGQVLDPDHLDRDPPSGPPDCFFRPLTGALHPAIASYRWRGRWTRIPLGRRFRISVDQFVAKCWDRRSGELLYHDAFTHIYKKRAAKATPPPDQPYNIAILQIDSTGRNQFFRHAPNTLHFLNHNHFHVLRGYTKVGDNSAINTLALLAGKVFEASYRGLDGLVRESDALDLNQTNSDLLHNVDFLFQTMARQGCVTMFNDDIGKSGQGLFHYQAFNGFRRPPTDFYFRPYYEYVYQNLNASSQCINGQFLPHLWMDLWERFSTVYKDQCHFSFTHLSALTHANGNNVQMYDEKLRKSLENLKSNGVLNNTFIVIVGDHGQRIHPIRDTYYGKVEERMPLAALHVPAAFRRAHPQLVRHLRANLNRLTSTLDLHRTLRHLAQRRPAAPGPSSLFQPVRANRSCAQAAIPDNFCVCQTPVGPLRELDWPNVTAQMDELITAELASSLERLDCVSTYVLTAHWAGSGRRRVPAFAISPLVRFGPRYMAQWRRHLEQHRGRPPPVHREYAELRFQHQLRVRARANAAELSANLVSRVQLSRRTGRLSMNVKPIVEANGCAALVLDRLCDCFARLALLDPAH